MNSYTYFEEVFVKAQEGSEEAKLELIKLCEGMVVNAVKKYAPFNMSIEDARQECYLVIFALLNQYNKDKSKACYYIRKNMEWHLRDKRKKKSELIVLDEPLDDEEMGNIARKDMLVDDVDIEDDYIAQESAYKWARFTATLTPRRMQVVNEHIIEGKPLKDVAAGLRITYRQAFNDKKMAIRSLKLLEMDEE